MSKPTAGNPDPELFLSSSDIHRAAAEGVLPLADAERLIQWGYEQRFSQAHSTGPAAVAPEQSKGLNLVTVAYYLGAMLMISACAWFLGDKWETLGSPGVFSTALIYMIVAGRLGWWLRGKGYVVGGGLLITVAVCLVPLLVYSIEDMLGLWPLNRPGDYEQFYPEIHGSWIVMELATIAAAAFALSRVRFAFLTAPMAVSFWFLSMDLAALILRDSYLGGNKRQWISVAVGAITMLVGYWFDRQSRRRLDLGTEDLAFWLYLFGLFAFWGGLTTMQSGSELKRAVYALINIGLMWLAVRLRRSAFLVFGVLGVHIYLGHLAYSVCKDSFLFPFALAGLGLSLILTTVLAQRYLKRGMTAEG